MARVQRRITQNAVPITLEDAESDTDPDGDLDDSDIDSDFQPGSPFGKCIYAIYMSIMIIK